MISGGEDATNSQSDSSSAEDALLSESLSSGGIYLFAIPQQLFTYPPQALPPLSIFAEAGNSIKEDTRFHTAIHTAIQASVKALWKLLKGRHHQDSLDTGSYVSTHPSCGAPPFRKLQNFELRSRVCVWGGEPFFYLMQWEPNLRV